jgi:shikimate kinase
VLTLVGLSGTGKTTIARMLSERWGWVCADLDSQVEDQAGCSIPEIFARDGEPTFRAMESAQLNRALGQEKVVVAAGGGAPCEPGAMDSILEAGPCIWLSALPQTLALRVTESEERPLLAAADPDAVVAHLADQLSQRQDIYTRAPFVIDTDGRMPLEVVEAIEALLKAEGTGPWAP